MPLYLEDVHLLHNPAYSFHATFGFKVTLTGTSDITPYNMAGTILGYRIPWAGIVESCIAMSPNSTPTLYQVDNTLAAPMPVLNVNDTLQTKAVYTTDHFVLWLYSGTTALCALTTLGAAVTGIVEIILYVRLAKPWKLVKNEL
jgi:hypothetical protein